MLHENDKYCLYCSTDHDNHAKLREHILAAHQTSYAARAFLAIEAMPEPEAK